MKPWLEPLRKFDGRRFDACAGEIGKRNYYKIKSFCVTGFLVGVINTAAEIALNRMAKFVPVALALVLYFLALLLLHHFFLRRDTKHITLIFYLIELPLMAAAILMGSFLDPLTSAVTIMVFLCVMPLFILDKPLRVVVYITATAAVFGLCSYIAKPAERFTSDMMSLITFWLIAVGVNLFSLQERIESVESMTKYRERSEMDMLTGVYNRTGGDERFIALVHNGIPGAFLILDIDDFKKFNDSYGHAAGDAVLVGVSDAIRRCFRDTDVVMRFGGDEFAVYATGLTERKKCEEKLDALRYHVKKIAVPETLSMPVTVSIGCVINAGSGEHVKLFTLADACLYRAKALGKDRFVIEETK